MAPALQQQAGTAATAPVSAQLAELPAAAAAAAAHPGRICTSEIKREYQAKFYAASAADLVFQVQPETRFAA